jgi:hypothetical protein
MDSPVCPVPECPFVPKAGIRRKQYLNIYNHIYIEHNDLHIDTYKTLLRLYWNLTNAPAISDAGS